MHMCVVRLFVESILRYGLPPQFQAAVVKPLPRMEARLRTVLATTFGTGAHTECLCGAAQLNRAHIGCDVQVVVVVCVYVCVRA